MSRPKNSLRMILCTFSGEDKFIVRKDKKWINRFAKIGFFVIAIFIGCFFSAYYFTDSLFEGNPFLSVPIGVIWGLLVVNMYLLLLYTVSPITLPTKKQYTVSDFLSASMIFRMLFMLLLAIIIAQPLNVWFFSGSVQPSLQRHILEEKARMIIVSDSIFVKKEAEALLDFNRYITATLVSGEQGKAHAMISKLKAKIDADERFLRKSITLLDSIDKINSVFFLTDKLENNKTQHLAQLSALVEEEVASDNNFILELENLSAAGTSWSDYFDACKAKLREAIIRKIQNYDELEVLLGKTNFYIKRNQLILTEVKTSWILTTVVCLLFLLPIYWKFKTRRDTDYYNYKSNIEKSVVVDEYDKLKEQYSKLLTKTINAYNNRSKGRIYSTLIKLKDIDTDKYKYFVKRVKTEYENEDFIRKYEYWKDCPFRTERHQIYPLKNAERELLKLLYPDE